MCGIVGAIAERDVVPILLEGLKRLEYRGYDSAGVAILDEKQALQRRRVLGKVQNLVNLIESEPLHGALGIAHTRWATHGIPAEINAHPHVSNGSIALVHNGIIENCEEIKEKLKCAGYAFNSETDTEVFAHLLHSLYSEEKDFLKALQKTSQALRGAYAVAIICRDSPGQLWAVRKGCPLVIGLGIQENFLASDKLALLPVTQQFIYLEEADIACISRKDIQIWDVSGVKVQRQISVSNLTKDMASKGQFRHFMAKEIFEQPRVLHDVVASFCPQGKFDAASFGKLAYKLFEQTKQVVIVACGTSYHAGLVAKYWFERIAGIPCTVEVASEFRYRSPVVVPGSLFVTISQSGETADTLAALRLAKTMKYVGLITICNVAESSLVRESDAVLLTEAGPEIGVASTKAFTTQLLILLLTVMTIANIHHQNIEALSKAVLSIPHYLDEVLALDDLLKQLAHQFFHKKDTLFLGRGANFPIALEGALKLKELSYIHAEAYPAGELKHGPLALVDHDMPIILLAPKNALVEKIYSNAQEVKSRNGQLFVFTNDSASFAALGSIIPMPSVAEIIEPIIYTIPLQLFAYHVAVLKGTDVDQPRNLAKSVTVE